MVTAALLDAVVVLAVLLMATVVPVAVLVRVHGRRGNHRGARHVRNACGLRRSHPASYPFIGRNTASAFFAASLATLVGWPRLPHRPVAARSYGDPGGRSGALTFHTDNLLRATGDLICQRLPGGHLPMLLLGVTPGNPPGVLCGLAGAFLNVGNAPLVYLPQERNGGVLGAVAGLPGRAVGPTQC
jgi:hypothetical protein